MNCRDHWELCRVFSLRPVSVILNFVFGLSSIILVIPNLILPSVSHRIPIVDCGLFRNDFFDFVGVPAFVRLCL
jgi:hypothetical protein